MSPRGARDVLDAWGPVFLWAAGILVVTTVPLPGRASMAIRHLDKLVHAAMYSGLGWTVARALHRTGRSTGIALFVAVAAAAGFAALNESIQAWVGREPDVVDWIADAVGLAAGLGLFLWLRRGRSERERSSTGDDGSE